MHTKCMKSVNSAQALKIAQENLYHAKIKQLDRNLDNFLKAKKIVSQQNSNNNKT